MVRRSDEAFLQSLKPAELHYFGQGGLVLIGSDASKSDCRHLGGFVNDFKKRNMKSGVDYRFSSLPVSTIAWLDAKTVMECR
jgi:hypothetical protein